MKATSRLLALVLLLLTALPLLSACGEEDTRPVVAVTIAPEAGLVRAVAGEDFRIVTLVPPGYSPEAYEPTVRELADFGRAEVYFSIGVPVEATSILPSLASATRRVSLDEAASAVYPELTIGGERDPHVWLSPKRLALMVALIADELSAANPERAETYRRNAAATLAELGAIDERIRTSLAASGVSDIIVYHPAFGYLADEYGLTMHALERDGREPTAAELAATVDFARERGIRTVFYQAETDSRGARAFAEEIGGRAVMLSPLAEDVLGNLEIMAEAIAAAEGSTP